MFLQTAEAVISKSHAKNPKRCASMAKNALIWPKAALALAFKRCAIAAPPIEPALCWVFNIPTFCLIEARLTTTTLLKMTK
jgi:hypothetical protein